MMETLVGHSDRDEREIGLRQICISSESWGAEGITLQAEEFRSYFTSFRESAFRLETLPSYAVSHEDKHFAAFLEGAKEPPFIFEEWKRTH